MGEWDAYTEFVGQGEDGVVCFFCLQAYEGDGGGAVAGETVGLMFPSQISQLLFVFLVFRVCRPGDSRERGRRRTDRTWSLKWAGNSRSTRPGVENRFRDRENSFRESEIAHQRDERPFQYLRRAGTGDVGGEEGVGAVHGDDGDEDEHV